MRDGFLFAKPIPQRRSSQSELANRESASSEVCSGDRASNLPFLVPTHLFDCGIIFDKTRVECPATNQKNVGQLDTGKDPRKLK